MPAIRVASKMKSGLPKPVHSAAPIPQVPALKLPAGHPSQIPLKPPRRTGTEGGGTPPKTIAVAESGADTQPETRVTSFGRVRIARSVAGIAVASRRDARTQSVSSPRETARVSKSTPALTKERRDKN
ncbi:hypothetical protein AAFF_G00106190 [Aldrovandia affinis]|uniref:Uncharacterized protein n=1 Tax=Aldrovandia affinis TaxID=143900 RepID=A0AAD7WXP6_9TELE|nr:hypothetical protein AAFF_G00106190 [Aldrovandia affinis]